MLTSNGLSKLLVNKPQVPRPCGILFFKVAVHWAMAFKPILLSKALVTHHPIPDLSAISIHSELPLKPPIKLGFKMMY